MRHGRHAMLLFVALVGICCTLVVSSAQAAPAATTAKGGKLSVGVQVLRFSASGRKVKAIGRVTGTLTDNLGHKTAVRTQIALTARAGGGGCKVLHLDLKELNLKLLGLHAHLDRVVLDVTGNRRGGVLGVLFCRLARAKVASARTAALDALNSAITRNKVSGRAVRFSAYLAPQTTSSQAPNASCPVLDLVVGPLNVQLLGLVVDLKRVHLEITAVRSEGKVGDLFCGLANR